MAGSNLSLDGPLHLIRPTTLKELSLMLNPEKILLTEDGHLRDWRGLAELMGCDMLKIQNLDKNSNPFSALVQEYGTKFQISHLLNFLEKMDRFDVLDDTWPLIEQDLIACAQLRSGKNGKEKNIEAVTKDDIEQLQVAGALMQYDAFVLYAEEDKDFAEKVVRKMEGEYGLKLCLKDRDLIAGLPFEHQAVTDVISNRCRFVLPIFSPNFLQCEGNKFVVTFAEALGIEHGCRKIVPCVYQQCTLPKSLSYYSRLDFTRANPYWDFWDKMWRSLANTSVSASEIQSTTTKVEDSGICTSFSKVEIKSSPSQTSFTQLSDSSESSLMNETRKQKSMLSFPRLKKIIKKPKKKSSKEKLPAAAC